MTLDELRAEADASISAQLMVQKAMKCDEVLDLLRFMCETWSEIDKWAYENVDDVALSKYPVIQGTSRQIRLINIGAQKYNASNIDSAIKWVLECQQESANI